MRRARRTAPLILGGLALLGLAAGSWAAPGGPGRAVATPEPLPEAQAPPEAQPLVPPSPPDAVAGALHEAWSAPAPSLAARVQRLQQVALELGIRRVDGAARALLLDGALGAPVERARAAVQLAPDLPSAHFALAGALLSDVGGFAEALAAARQGLLAVPHHLDAHLWARAAVLQAGAWALVGGAALFLAVAGVVAVPRAVLDLAGLPGSLPSASRFALLAGLLLVPAALGEGALGVALGAAGLAFAYGPLGRRAAVVVALAALWIGLFPVADRFGEARAALGADPVAEAAWWVERGAPPWSERARVAHATASHPLAARAQALRMKREGDLAGADAAFAPLLADAEPTLLNNAAGVKLALGRVDEAIALYEQAARDGRSATILFNLSQAYGRTVRLEQQESALAEAQLLDAREVADLTTLFASVHGALAPVDTPPRVERVAAALAGAAGASDAARLAAGFRSRLAPGALGAGPSAAGVGAALALGVGLALGFALSRLSAEEGGDFYLGVARVLQGRGVDPSRRMERLAELRARQARLERVEVALSCVVPGAAGVLARRPWLGLVAALLFAGALSAWLHRDGVVPDPLALGAGAGLVAAAAAGLLAAGYAAVTALALALREGA